MTNYFRITAYHPEHDVSVIADSNGYFSKLWEFSSFFVNKGFKIIAVGTDEKFAAGNFAHILPTKETIAFRACDMGKPIIENGTITVRGRRYIPNVNA